VRPDRIADLGETQVCTSIIVAAELRHGAAKKASTRLTARVEAILSALDTLPFDAPADDAYGRIRTQLELAGTPIGGNDLLIAAQAVSLGYTVVTDNQSKFERVAGLSVENWL
jgi:tRNA(fMet)-specific endonuclease VapC